MEFLVKGEDVYFMGPEHPGAVEHTITEQITGVDIVQEQIRIASGLPYQRQDEISMRGFAGIPAAEINAGGSAGFPAD